MSESEKIETESQYQAALRALSKRSRPPLLLRLLMQGLEAYRQSRRMGWSRKQNKYGARTYATFKLGKRVKPFAEAAFALSKASFSELEPAREAFFRELVEDPNLMGFLFFQDVNQKTSAEGEEAGIFETVTLSLGRVVPDAKRFRDRVDLILDARVVDDVVGELSQLRLYVDPFKEHAPSELRTVQFGEGAGQLLEKVAALYQEHRDDESLLWDHWTQDYIDYFGPREHALRQTRFPTALDDAFEASLAHGTVSVLSGEAEAHRKTA